MKAFILTFIPALLLLSSCKQDVYFNIPENEKPLIQNNAHLYYTDSENNIDSFLITRTDDYSISDKRYYHELIYISYAKMNLSRTFKRFFSMHQSRISISVDGNYFNDINKNEVITNLQVGGVTYNQVYHLKSNNFPDSIPNSVYFTYKNGIIKYTYKDGRSFELQKRN